MRTTMKNLFVLIVLMLAFCSASAHSDSTYSFEGHIGGGFSRNLSTFDYPPPGELNQSGFNGFARFLWSPEHLLEVGVEIGITSMYSITPPDSSALDKSTLNAYPFYLVLGMRPIDNLYICGAFGSAILSSVAVVEGEGNTAVTSFSTSVYLSAAYMQPLTEDLRLGGEIRATTFDRYKDFNMSFNIVLSASVIRY